MIKLHYTLNNKYLLLYNQYVHDYLYLIEIKSLIIYNLQLVQTQIDVDNHVNFKSSRKLL
jgi:hypothetical protein